MRTIDTRGLSCPQPLVLFHQAIAENADTPLFMRPSYRNVNLKVVSQ